MKWKTSATLLGVFIAFMMIVAVSLANMNTLNLIITGTKFGTLTGGEASNMENFDVTEEAKKQGDSDEDKYGRNGMSTADGYWKQIVTGGGAMSFGGGAGSIDLFWLLQNAKDPDKSSYAYQILDVLANMTKSKYYDADVHGHPASILASHYNETKMKSFVEPNAGPQAQGGSGSVLSSSVTLENSYKGNVPNSGSGNVYKDNGGDGLPDGPHQLEQGRKDNKYASKLRGDGVFDVFSFADSLTYTEQIEADIIRTFKSKGFNLSRQESGMLFALNHNRGPAGIIWILHGLPYAIDGGVNAKKYLKAQAYESLTKEQMESMMAFPKKLISWANTSNIPLEIMAKDSKAAFIFLTLKNGGFLNAALQPQTVRHIMNLGDSDIALYFPGQNKSTIVDYINKTYVKKPWEAVGMDRATFDKYYGSSRIQTKYEEVYRSAQHSVNTTFYFDKDNKSDLYQAGTQSVLTAMEGVAGGYLIDVGILGDYYMLRVAETAGIKALQDGTVVDPTNPAAFYKSNGVATASAPTISYVWVPYNTSQTGQPQQTTQAQVTQASIAYDPSDLSLDANFAQFLKELNLYGKLTKAQLGQISTLYKYSGGGYSQGSRGQLMKDKVHYWTDCSLLTWWGLYMDRNMKGTTTANFKSNEFIVGRGPTHPYKGTQYQAKLVQLDAKGNSRGVGTTFSSAGTYSMRDVEWVDYLRTGDIANGRSGSGHVWTYLGKNTTDKKMVVPVEISRVSAAFSEYDPGEHFTMESSWRAKTHGDDKMGLHPKGTHVAYDTSGRPYQAFRPVYNPYSK